MKFKLVEEFLTEDRAANATKYIEKLNNDNIININDKYYVLLCNRDEGVIPFLVVNSHTVIYDNRLFYQVYSYNVARNYFEYTFNVKDENDGVVHKKNHHVSIRKLFKYLNENYDNICSIENYPDLYSKYTSSFNAGFLYKNNDEVKKLFDEYIDAVIIDGHTYDKNNFGSIPISIAGTTNRHKVRIFISKGREVCCKTCLQSLFKGHNLIDNWQEKLDSMFAARESNAEIKYSNLIKDYFEQCPIMIQQGYPGRFKLKVDLYVSAPDGYKFNYKNDLYNNLWCEFNGYYWHNLYVKAAGREGLTFRREIDIEKRNLIPSSDLHISMEEIPPKFDGCTLEGVEINKAFINGLYENEPSNIIHCWGNMSDMSELTPILKQIKLVEINNKNRG